MANTERVRGNDIGPTGITVGENISRVRKSQQISLQALEARLSEIGRKRLAQLVCFGQGYQTGDAKSVRLECTDDGLGVGLLVAVAGVTGERMLDVIIDGFRFFDFVLRPAVSGGRVSA